MATLGLNELQLHFADNGRLGITSARHPEVNVAPQWASSQVRDIVDFAAECGVSVVPELDMPGHIGWLLSAHPEFAMSGGGADGVIDITNDAAIAFLDDIIDEYAELFAGSPHWHLGFDEIFSPFTQGQAAGRLADIAREKFGPLANEHDLITDVANRYVTQLAQRGFGVGVWNDTLLKSAVVPLDRTVTVNYWTRWNDTYAAAGDIAAAGYSLLNYNDYLLYYALAPQYEHPTVERILKLWRPEVFSPRLQFDPQSLIKGGTLVIDSSVQSMFPKPEFQILDRNADNITGATFSIWADMPEAETEDQIFTHVKEPLAAFALKAWNPNSSVTANRVRQIVREATG